MDVKVTNATDAGVPMTLARVGLPGGLTFQTWQLQELRDKKLIDFYETRAREVILYFRALPPSAVRDIPLELMADRAGHVHGARIARVPVLHRRAQALGRAADGDGDAVAPGGGGATARAAGAAAARTGGARRRRAAPARSAARSRR